MQRIITTGIVLLLMALQLGSCSSWREPTVRLTEQDLQARINENFPISKNYLFVGTVTFANPRINLRRDDDRVGLGINISLENSGGGVRSGVVEMIAAVLYDAETKALFLAQPELQHFAIDGVPEQNVRLLSALAMPAFEKLLRRNPVYSLSAEGGTKKFAAMLVKDIRVRNGCLEIIFGV
jgi:hypothetical protein